MAKFIQLSFPQGDDVTYTFTLKDPQGNAISIVGASVESQVRQTYDGPLIASFTTQLVDPLNGKFSISLDDETTSTFPIINSKTKFVFDVELTYSDGTKNKIVYGNLIVTREVTR